jgi:hypothetical protein
MPYVGKSPDLNASVDTNELADDAVTLGKIGEDVKTAISGSFLAKADKSAISGSIVGGVSGSAASTGSFGSIYVGKNVNASAFVGDGSSLTGIDIPSAADISGSFEGGGSTKISGSSTSTGSFGRIDALKIGRDTHNQFDFATDNVIKVSVNAVDDEFRFAAGGDFHADGDVYAYSGTTASDVSLKKNITDTKYGLDDIMKLRGVDFDWKRDDMGHSVGVLAQEVEVIIPEVVKEYDGMKGRDKVKGVDYNKLVPVLIESIKELKLKLDEQDAIIRDITERELEAK